MDMLRDINYLYGQSTFLAAGPVKKRYTGIVDVRILEGEHYVTCNRK